MLYLLDSSVKYIYMPFYPCALVYQDIQYFVCDLPKAPYVVYSVPHMWPIQCSICGISSASYMAYPVLHIRPTQSPICGLPKASYVVYSVPHM